MSHGLTAVLTSGTLPPGCSYVRKICLMLRKVIDAAVIERHGSISLYRSAVIQSAIRWERHALLSQRWLRLEATLTADQRLAFSREIPRASSERDKCLRLLGLGDSADPVTTFLDAVATESGPGPDANANGNVAGVASVATDAAEPTPNTSSTPDAPESQPERRDFPEQQAPKDSQDTETERAK